MLAAFPHMKPSVEFSRNAINTCWTNEITEHLYVCDVAGTAGGDKCYEEK